jgi:hypothetical protein
VTDKTAIQSNKIQRLLIRVENLYHKIFNSTNINIIGVCQLNIHNSVFDKTMGRLNFISCYNEMNHYETDNKNEGIIHTSNLYVNCIIKFITIDKVDYKNTIITPKYITFCWITNKPVGGGIISCLIFNSKTKKAIHLKNTIIKSNTKINVNGDIDVINKTYYMTELIDYKRTGR